MKSTINKICYLVFSVKEKKRVYTSAPDESLNEHEGKSGWLAELLQSDNPGILDNDLDIKGFHEAMDSKAMPRKVQRNFLFAGLPFFQTAGNVAVAVCLFFFFSMFFSPSKDPQHHGLYHTDSLFINQQDFDTLQRDHALKDSILR